MITITIKIWVKNYILRRLNSNNFYNVPSVHSPIECLLSCCSKIVIGKVNKCIWSERKKLPYSYCSMHIKCPETSRYLHIFKYWCWCIYHYATFYRVEWCKQIHKLCLLREKTKYKSLVLIWRETWSIMGSTNFSLTFLFFNFSQFL